MRKQRIDRTVALASIVVLVLAGACSSDADEADDTSSSPPTSAPSAASAATTSPRPAGDDCPTAGAEWEVAKVYIEHNATDGDTGFHGFFGGEPWRTLCVVDPDGNPIWDVRPDGRLADLGVSDLFFESNEPPNDEYPPDDLRADFPEGTYVVAGIDVDGVARLGEATFTHAIPGAPAVLEPTLADEDEVDAAAPVPPTGLVVRWEPVTSTIDSDPVTITGYEVIVTDEEVDDPDGFARPLVDVHVRPDVTELVVPDGFLEPDHLYELEVLSIEESGNQTITVGFFQTR